MTSLRDMNTRRQAWLDEKPQGNNNELWLRAGDVVLFQFVGNGNDGDQFIKIYRSHIFEFGSKQNPRYCPVRSGEPELGCVLCDQGHDVIKERMSLWFFVSHILHSSMPEKVPEGKVFSQVEFQGRYYFAEEINGFRIWHASAWRDSPWSDICNLSEIYNGLHNFTAQLTATGEKTQRRYKVFAMPETPHFPPEKYAEAKEECTPIPQILHSQLGAPVAANPVPAAANNDRLPFSLPGAAAVPVTRAMPVMPMSLPGAAPAPTLQIPTLQPPSATQVATPLVVQETEAPEEEEEPSTTTETQQTEEAAPEGTTTRRPLKTFF